jgi:hypothetical protein
MQPERESGDAQDVGLASRRPDDEIQGDRSHRPPFSRDRDGRPQALIDHQNEAPSVARNNKISDFPEYGDDPASQNPPLHPFSVFKRFVDNQVSLLADNFARLPENFHKNRDKMQREQERFIEEECDISRRWTGSDDSPDQIQLSCQRASPEFKELADEATMELLEGSMHHHRTTPFTKVLALFRDDVGVFGELGELVHPALSVAGSWSLQSDEGHKHSLAAPSSWYLGRQPRWLSVEWFKRSPYSPIRLEAHSNSDMAGARWRAAFEDLVCASLDKPMTSKGSHQAPARISTYTNPTARSSGLQWLIDLQERGILPPLLPRTYNSLEARNMRTTGEVMRLVHESRANIPLPFDPAILSCTATEQDLSDMISELVTEYDPLQSGRDSQTWTELDMYDKMLPSTSTKQAVESHNRDRREGGARSHTDGSGGHGEDLFTLLAKALGQEMNRQVETSPAGVRAKESMVDRGCDAMNDGNMDEDDTSSITATKNPGVLSSLTTTETIRQPGGTVTTKIVLKQRFADGREETSERSHTYQEDSEMHKEEPNKKGWFWA